jgi:VWFA-related protein
MALLVPAACGATPPVPSAYDVTSLERSRTKRGDVMRAAFVLAVAMAMGVPGSAWRAATERTVYVTATDDKRDAVTDLTAADFVVKEGGKEREIVKAERATTPMRLALAVEERLTADASVRMALFEFMKRLNGSAEIALITIGLRNTVIVDYTTSPDALVGGINKFTLNPAKESAIADGVLDLAGRFIDAKPARPVIVVMALSGGQAGVDPKTVLDKVRQSGATMHAVTLAGAGDGGAMGVGSLAGDSGREQVLGDGTKQSGGRRIDVTATAAMPKAMLQIANELMAQYAITYTLPDGVKPDRRFSVSVKRRGVSVRGPAQIPDR